MTLRPVAGADESFLARLYATTRDDLRAVPGWSEDEVATVIDFQFQAQKADYAKHYPAEGHRIIELEGTPIGRVWLDRRDQELLIVDMALLPEYRSAGIGTRLLRDIFAQADEVRLPVCLMSEKTNPRAIALCERLGFAVVADDELFVSLVREPSR